MSELLQLGFDRYQRFMATAVLIGRVARQAGQERLSVLDVGDLDGALAPFLPGHDYHPWQELVTSQGGGLKLPDQSRDVVVAMDVLEHVAPSERPFFLAELARVSRLALLVGFPIISAQAAEEFVLSLTGNTWLAEHQEQGLPDPAQVEAMLRDLGLSFERHPNSCLASWTAMMLLIHGLEDARLFRLVNSFFNQHFALGENREPAYRYIYLCRRR